MRNVQQWLDAYSESHRHPRNKLLHWIGIPLIAFSLLGLLSMVSTSSKYMNLATLLVVGSLIYYLFLSPRLAAGMTVVFGVMLWAATTLNASMSTGAFVMTMVGIFAFGWVLQFIGHGIEGKKPSFFEDLQFLLIGPLWLLADAYRRAGWGFESDLSLTMERRNR